jgi:hypothetical protein
VNLSLFYSHDDGILDEQYGNVSAIESWTCTATVVSALPQANVSIGSFAMHIEATGRESENFSSEESADRTDVRLDALDGRSETAPSFVDIFSETRQIYFEVIESEETKKGSGVRHQSLAISWK